MPIVYRSDLSRPLTSNEVDENFRQSYETFIWTQSTPAAVWTVPHNLGKFPSVIVVDGSGLKIEPNISYDLLGNIVTITHSSPTTGKAYIN